MSKKTNRKNIYWLLAGVLISALLITAPVFAQGEAPPEAPVSEEEAAPAEEAPAEETAQEAAPAEEPPAEETPPAEEPAAEEAPAEEDAGETPGEPAAEPEAPPAEEEPVEEPPKKRLQWKNPRQEECAGSGHRGRKRRAAGHGQRRIGRSALRR